jgi:hypothetical protein
MKYGDGLFGLLMSHSWDGMGFSAVHILAAKRAGRHPECELVQACQRMLGDPGTLMLVHIPKVRRSSEVNASLAFSRPSRFKASLAFALGAQRRSERASCSNQVLNRKGRQGREANQLRSLVRFPLHAWQPVAQECPSAPFC